MFKTTLTIATALIATLGLAAGTQAHSFGNGAKANTAADRPTTEIAHNGDLQKINRDRVAHKGDVQRINRDRVAHKGYPGKPDVLAHRSFRDRPGHDARDAKPIDTEGWGVFTHRSFRDRPGHDARDAKPIDTEGWGVFAKRPTRLGDTDRA